MLVIDRTNAAESTGHGSPLPVLVHGGPGRAGGSEEMGGVRGVKHYMQRTAIQSSPAMIAAITEQYIPGAPKHIIAVHPFRLKMSELHIGDTWKTDSRTVTLEDIEHFAEFTGDKFYAHMDEEAAKASPIFEGRVAHGYLILSFAAGLFVDPDPGPVLANTGLENLRFLTPLYPGDSMRVELTVRSKSLKSEDTGVVRWAVEVFNQTRRAGRDLRPPDRERAVTTGTSLFSRSLWALDFRKRRNLMKVSEVMTRDVQTIRPDQTVREAASFMLRADAGSIPVTEGDRLLGMITDRDIAVRGVAEGHGPDTPVRELMTNDMVCARIDDDVEDAATKMSEAQVRRLPVVDEQERLCGIVSLGDLSRETDIDCAAEALEGVSQPGGQHQQ